MAEGETVILRVGHDVWIPHAKEGWIGGTISVIDAAKNELVVIPEDGGDEIRISKNKVELKNPDILEGVPDLSQLSYMHEPGILYNLQTRYQMNLIYTYIGKILIAINPYARLPLFGIDMIRAYFGQPLGALAPHVYAIAQDAFKDMRLDGVSQSILVSGESGAGKTETTKFLLQYFAAMGNILKQDHVKSLKKAKSDLRIFDSKSIEERVLESTPLLEAFGNAKTLRNDNSSRFGKFIEIHFDEGGFIMGARIQTYLLEKSRIFRQVPNERNYHIFYQFLMGSTNEVKRKFNLKEPSFYAYLNQSNCTEIEGVSDQETFRHTLTAMSVSGGISEEEKQDVFSLLATVLWLGNITFLKRKYDDSIEINSPEALETAASLIQCSKEQLTKALTTRTVHMKNEKLIVTMTAEQSQSARDSLSMLLYSQMFDWLVSRINKSIHQIGKSKFFIGVLDIYGFESFTKNSFEQFCINYANEKLQQLFNQHVFKEEQQEYIKEKISWAYIDFVDNQDTLDLIEKKPKCVLSILDEESQFPKATSLTLADKLCNILGSHPKFEKPRFSNSTGMFTIVHYAGRVKYDTESFLDKNKDFILPEQIILLRLCKNGFLSSLLPASLTPDQQFKFVSVGSQFSASLAGLMKTISATSPHYIRCIKPNPTKSPQVFVKDDVMHQLKCGGVMESVRICCAGFPTRRSLDVFFDRYKMLHPSSNRPGVNPKQIVPILLAALNFPEDKYKIGLTKVFMRAGLIAKLEDMRNLKLNNASVVIQKYYRRFYARRAYKALRTSSIITQAYLRRLVAHVGLRQLRETAAAISIQTFYRTLTCKNSFEGKRRSAIVVQRAIKLAASKNELAERRYAGAVLSLQTYARKVIARRSYMRMIVGIRRLQAKWRGKLARRQYVILRIEARSVKSLQNVKSQLEGKLEELQWRLGAEKNVRHQAEKEKDELAKALEDEKDKHVLELSEAKKKYSVSSDDYNKLVQLLDQSKHEIIVLTDAKHNLERQVTESEETFQKQIHALLLDLSSQKEIVQTKQTEIDNIKWTFSQIEKEKARLEAHAEEAKWMHENQMRDIRNQKEDLASSQDELKAEVRKWQEAAKSHKYTLEGEMAALQQRLSVDQETNASLQAQVNSLSKSASKSASEFELLQQESQSQIGQLKLDILSQSDPIGAQPGASPNRDETWQMKFAERDAEHQRKWAEREVEYQKKLGEKQISANPEIRKEEWAEREEENQKKRAELAQQLLEKEKQWEGKERQWNEKEKQWKVRERQWTEAGVTKEKTSDENKKNIDWDSQIAEQERQWKLKWDEQDKSYNNKLNEQRTRWNEKETEWANVEKEWAGKEKSWAEEVRKWSEKERQREEKEVESRAQMNEEWLGKLLAQEKLWNEKWVEREDEQEKKWNEQERRRGEELQEKDQGMIGMEKMWSDRLAYETQKGEDAARRASQEKHESRTAVTQLEEARDAQTQQFHALQAQALVVDAERQRAQTQLIERDRELGTVLAKLNQVQEKYKSGMERLTAEKQQMAEQIDKFNMDKMREGIESSAKTMVDAVKHELVISNLEKDIIRLKMEADRIAQAHELEEKNWKRVEVELKDNLSNRDAEMKQLQSLRSKFENEFFGLKEKSSSATQETFYLKEVNTQLQGSHQRIESELSEKKQQYEALAQECDASKKAHAALALENQKLNDKLASAEQSVHSLDKKKSKFKEYEELVAGKLDARKAEIAELKANQSKDLAALQKTIDEQRDKMNNHSTELFKQQLLVQQAESNAARNKEDLERAREDANKLKKKHKQSKAKGATKLSEETGPLKVQIELLKKEISDLNEKSKSKEKDKDRDREKEKEKDREKGDTEKTLRNAQEKNLELQAEVVRVQGESARVGQENVRLTQDNAQLWNENEKLNAYNAELLSRLQLFDEAQINRSSEVESNSNDLSRSQEVYRDSFSPKSEDMNQWKDEDKEVQIHTQFMMSEETQRKDAEIQAQRDMIRKADAERIVLESNVRMLTEDKILAVQKYQRLESECAEMKRLFSPLRSKSEKLRMLERINDAKETEYQKLARTIGFEPTPTLTIFRELTSFGDHRHHDLVKLIYHQITYWNIIEFEDLPVLQAVVNSYSNLITKYSQDLDVLTHIFSGASLLLYMLYKYKDSDLEDIVNVEPLDVKQTIQEEARNRARSNGSFTNFQNVPPVSLGRTSSFTSESRDSFLPRATTPDVSYLSQSPASPSYLSSSPSPTPPSHSPVPNSNPTLERGPSAKLRPLRSSGDFFSHLKALVGRCFGLLLSFVASRLDPLLDQAILVENFSSRKRNELPSLRPVISFLQKTLAVFQVNLVHLSLSQQFFSEVFSRINNILMNGVLLRQQFCTETFGSYLKSQIESIQLTADEMGQMWIGDVSTCFQGIKQIAAVLSLSNKNSLAEDKIRKAACPNLNSLQLRQLLSMFTPGEFGKRVPIPIINAIGAKAPHSESDRILLDVNVVKPFPIKILHYFEVDDMLKTAITPAVRNLVDGMSTKP